jgi:predicted ATPase
MLIEFKVENFRSFRDEQTFSMVSSRDTAHPDSLIACKGFSIAKTGAVYGSNASGKSNLIKAISVVERLVLASATRMNLGDRIDVSPFRLNAAMRLEPSRFEMTVIIDDITYVYGFAATTERVHDESLYVRRPGGRLTPWIKRKLDPSTEKTAWQIKGPIKRDAALLQSKTRDNGLLLSRGAELNIGALAPLFVWFRSKLRFIDLSSSPDHLLQATAHRMIGDVELQSRILQLVRDADFGISKIQVAETSPALPNEDDVSDDIRALFETILAFKRREAGLGELPTMISVSTEHTQYPSGEGVRFSLEDDESNGTRRFFALAGPILDALENGHVLVIDELDCSMHPLLTRKLIELFQDRSMNQNGAQLIFATHDSSIMDSSLFRRDQIWLTEKRRDGSTDLFSLYDIDSKKRPRGAEALEKNYLAGRYGAIPKFGPTLEDMEVR